MLMLLLVCLNQMVNLYKQTHKKDNNRANQDPIIVFVSDHRNADLFVTQHNLCYFGKTVEDLQLMGVHQFAV